MARTFMVRLLTAQRGVEVMNMRCFNSFPLLAVAFVVRGLKEFGEPTRKALIMDLAPDGEKAAMFGAYYRARDIVVSGAALSSGFLWQISPAANLLTAAACGLAGTAIFAWRGRDL